MSNILLGLITLSCIVAVGVAIFVMIELKGAIRALREFIKTTEGSLKPTLEEFQQTLRSMRNVTDNVTGVTEDVRVLSSSVRDVGENVKRVSELVEDVTSTAAIKVSGLRAGINAATDVLLKNIFSGRK
ncbi:MAG TPA: DUF948 domain-containing protein [Thermodesulfovibrionales bacterium]|nr:DUF948 domain-containing protein [Thermodesulfovibrionales bacterium]